MAERVCWISFPTQTAEFFHFNQGPTLQLNACNLRNYHGFYDELRSIHSRLEHTPECKNAGANTGAERAQYPGDCVIS